MYSDILALATGKHICGKKAIVEILKFPQRRFLSLSGISDFLRGYFLAIEDKGFPKETHPQRFQLVADENNNKHGYASNRRTSNKTVHSRSRTAGRRYSPPPVRVLDFVTNYEGDKSFGSIQAVYTEKKKNTPSTGKRIHGTRQNGLPLCGSPSRKAPRVKWQAVDDQITCPSCLSRLKRSNIVATSENLGGAA